MKHITMAWVSTLAWTSSMIRVGSFAPFRSLTPRAFASKRSSALPLSDRQSLPETPSAQARREGDSSSVTRSQAANDDPSVPLYRAQGLLCVYKPREWTSNDVVSYIRGILDRDAKLRGARPARVNARRHKDRIVRVGHGGTLDPLATGVLVIGVGSGTKQLQNFLDGSKRYRVAAELGYETTTLDLEGNVTKQEPFEHVTRERIEQALPSFVGEIDQIPPIFSAIQKNGKRLYELAREGASEAEVAIPPRRVKINHIQLLSCDIPKFELEVDCGGGTYIRSLVRDIGQKVGSVATTTLLERTKQGQFTIDSAMMKEKWSADSIYDAIIRFNEQSMGSACEESS